MQNEDGNLCVLGLNGRNSDWDLIEIANSDVFTGLVGGKLTIRRSTKSTGDSVVHHGKARTYAKEPVPVLILPGSRDVFALEKGSATESTMQVLLPIAAVRSNLEETTASNDLETGSNATSASGCVVSALVTFRVTKPMSSDLFALVEWLVQQTRLRAEVWRVPGAETFAGVTVEELLNAPVDVSTPEALNDFFETFPVLVVPTHRPSCMSTDMRLPWRGFELIPLDEEEDLAKLVVAFSRNLRQHLREMNELERDAVHEFSFFTALFILGRSCSEIEFSFSALRIDDDNLPAIQEYSAALLTRPVCAYQLMRYFATAIKNGFEFIVAPTPENSTHFLDSIGGLEMMTHEMTVTQKVGVRLTYSTSKAALLQGIPQIRQAGRPLLAESLVNYHYGSEGPVSLASLIEVEPAVKLSICSVARVSEVFEDLLGNVNPPSGPATPLRDAILAEQNRHGSERNSTEAWVPWNWRLSIINETTRLMLMGKVMGKRMLSKAYESFGMYGMEKHDCWLPMLLAGRAFLCGLPEDFLDHLDAEGQLRVDRPASFSSTLRAFVIECDSRRLSWNWKDRLTTLYKLCPLWSKEILFEYVCPTLAFEGAPSFEEIISAYLKPSTDSPLLTNQGLCLEHSVRR